MNVQIAALFFILFSLQINAKEICKINIDKYKIQSPVDSVVCHKDLKNPSEKPEEVLGPIINFITKEKEQKIIVRKLEVFDHFLSNPENINKCSNYKILSKEYNTEFQSYLSKCEKKPNIIDRINKICKWVLPKYNTKIINGFYDFWNEANPDGQLKVKSGKKVDELELPIRAQESWCRKVAEDNKGQIFINCQPLTEWVDQFNRVQKIDMAVKRDLKLSEKARSEVETEKSRQEAFKNMCKYFDTHPVTSSSQALYIECITN